LKFDDILAIGIYVIYK